MKTLKLSRRVNEYIKIIPLSLACVVIGFCLSGKLLGARTVSTLPHDVSVQPEYVDFGNVAEGRIVEQKIRIANVNNYPVKLAKVSSTCGCTTTQSPESIPPHGEAFLKVLYDSAERNSAFRQFVTVQFAKPDSGEVVIPVSGQVEPVIDLSQRSLSLGDGREKAGQLTLTRHDNLPLTAKVRYAPEGMNVSSSQISPSVIRVTATLQTGGSAGAHRETIVLSTNHPEMPEVNVPVSWEVPSEYSIEPKILNLGVMAAGTPLNNKLHISGANVARIEVVSTPPGIKVKVEHEKNVATLQVSGVISDQKEGLLNTEITLKTGDSLEPNIVIPVVAAFGKTSDEPCRPL